MINKTKLTRGQKVLVNGASGGIGSAAVQLLKYFGAFVVAVCNTKNLELVQSLGADKVIDYTQSDFSKSSETYDVVFDTVGKAPFSSSIQALMPSGTLLLASAWPAEMLKGLWTSMTTSKKVIAGGISETASDMAFLAELMEAGKLKSVIDKTYPLAQIAEAHRYVDGGHKKGNVVIRVV